VSARLDGATVAIVGFGNQGGAQAAILAAAGVRVIVGARAGGPSAERARALGFEVRPPAEAVAHAGIVAMLVPDEAIPEVWAGIAAAVPPRATVVFAHGFALCYGALAFPAGLDVVLVSPTGPGAVLEARARAGRGLPAFGAVHVDASGEAWRRVEDYAAAIACTPVLRTSVREETEVDLFGEQTVLCGGMNALVTAAFETLVDAGYTPEVAYLECVHQLKYLADLLHHRGIAGFREGISGTARYGDLTRGPRVVGEASRAAMREILEEIRSGAFAREWLAEAAGGRATLRAAEVRDRAHPMEAARRQALGGSEPPPETP